MPQGPSLAKSPTAHFLCLSMVPARLQPRVYSSSNLQCLLFTPPDAPDTDGAASLVLQVVDLSRAAAAGDMRPSRLAVMIGCCKSFIREYFDQNPLSYLSIMVMRNGMAFRLTELSGSPERQISELNAHMDTGKGQEDTC